MMSYFFFYTLGRVIFGGYFLYNAFNHLVKSNALAGYAASKGVKNPKAAVIGSGLLLLVGGLSVLTGFMMSWGAVALIIFLVPVTYKMHAFWKEQDPMARANQQVAFAKNVALIGAALMMIY